MVKRGQIRRCQRVDKLGRHVVAMSTPPPPANVLFLIASQKTIILFRNEIWLCEKTYFFTVFTTTHWVKPAWPGEPILLTSTLLMEVQREPPAKPASYKCKHFGSDIK